MKKSFTLLFFVFSVIFVSAQQASDYFPKELGYVWNYKVIPLDSLNNNIESLAFQRQDTFAVEDNYIGKLSAVVPTKNGPAQTLQIQPYLDTLFFSFDGADGYEYFSTGTLAEIMTQLDSMQIATSFSFLSFFNSLEDWYPVYKFAANVNAEYQLLQRDTTIALNVGSYHFRFEYLGKRFDDENLSTTAGMIKCKKILLRWKGSIIISPLLPPLQILTTNDTIWIAPDRWIVQDIIPTNNIDLSFFGFDEVSIPGLKTEIEVVADVRDNDFNLQGFYLSQNYPNPFNPSTKIRYTISTAPQSPPNLSQEEASVGTSFMKFVTLKVYDVLGNEIATLVNEEKPAGEYEAEFDGTNLPSGIYFYQLKAGRFIETKKMVLIR